MSDVHVYITSGADGSDAHGKLGLTNGQTATYHVSTRRLHFFLFNLQLVTKLADSKQALHGHVQMSEHCCTVSLRPTSLMSSFCIYSLQLIIAFMYSAVTSTV